MAKKNDPRVIQAYKFNSLLPTDTPEAAPIDLSYFNERMTALGITQPDLYSFVLPEYENKYKPYFTPNSKGDIIIHYPALENTGQETYPDGDTNKPFYRLRFHPNRASTDAKYIQPSGSGVHLFYPLAFLEKYQKAEKIDTLFVVEGEFKATAGNINGLDIIGLGGKDLFTGADKTLHPEIVKVIERCKVDNLVYLLDADLFDFNFDPENEPNKNIAKRPYSFFNAVMKFRELTKSIVKDSYMMHVSERFINEAKGLDDLLHSRKDNTKEIIKDALKLTQAKPFFGCIHLGSETPHAIKTYFNLTIQKGMPAAFYAYHQQKIGEHEFNFNGFKYKFVEDIGLQMVKHADSNQFIRVGCDYFKLIQVPNTQKKGVLDQKRIPWRPAEITRDYTSKGFKNFFDQIIKYNAFCNVPDNTANYQAVLANCFNLYSKIEHIPEPGKFPNIEKYLKHVFGEAVLSSGFTNYDMALDYLTLLYLQPRQKLPILCLVNKRKNTGKSTFLWLLKEIFQANCTFIGNEELKDHLNDDWSDKLVIGIDEGFIDKKSVLERLKSMSTSHTIKLRGMYAGRQEIAFFGKFVLTSNDEDNFAPIDEDEVRFWVNKVPQLTEDDPDLLDKMTAEIPAFLDHLQNRTLVHPKKTRAYFSFDLMDNNALKNVKQSAGTWFMQELKETIKDLFFEYQYHTLVYTSTELMSILNNTAAGAKFRKSEIIKQLRDRFNITAKLGRYEAPLKPEPNNPYAATTAPKRGRCFVFKVEDFLNQEELETEFSEFFTSAQIQAFRHNERIANSNLEEDVF